jgi:uncharacterized SAM-binding protein YcdF (DUF218 family)
MFVFLSKFLPLFVYPLGLTFVLVVLALFLRRRARLRTALLAAAVLILYASSNRWVSYALARSLEWRYLPLNPVPQAEVIVVLGGATEPEQYPRPVVEVNAAGDRVLYAAQLYKAGRAPAILLSGGNITWMSGRSMTPADEMAQILELIGIPREVIWMQPESQNTYEDALYSSQILKEKGIERVLLVTSAMHMPRSVALFEHQGIQVIPAPVDYTLTQQGWDNLNAFDPQATLVNLLPNTSSLSLTTNVLKEYIGLLVYGLRGWL